MPYDARAAGGYPDSGYGGYGARAAGGPVGGYGAPPPRGVYPGARGGYGGVGRGGGPMPPPYAGGRGGFGGYDPYYGAAGGPARYGAASVHAPVCVLTRVGGHRCRGGYDARMDYYGDGGYGRGRGAAAAGYPPQHSAYGRRVRPYDYPPSASGYPARPYER
jgi:hypothetical protein